LQQAADAATQLLARPRLHSWNARGGAGDHRPRARTLR
jgi:hypothetical protein